MHAFIGRERASRLHEWPARAKIVEIIKQRAGDGRGVVDRDAGGVPLVVGETPDRRQPVAEANSALRSQGERAEGAEARRAA